MTSSLPFSRDAYDLMHEGAIALAEVESNGIRIDMEYLDSTISKLRRRIARKEKALGTSEVMTVWKKTYGTKTNINSGEQLGEVLFEKMGFPAPERTEAGRHKTDISALSAVDHPFVQDYLKVRKLQKALSTNLVGLKREVCDGFLHPFFNLHTTQTFRSSSESPNFQNIPVRDPVIGSLVRKAFIAREGRQLVEIDYSGIEVRIAACYHKDPKMLTYIHDPTTDMHRDMAMELFLLSQEEVTKKSRYHAKNGFVFAEFYGDWYLDCARSLWAAVEGLTTASGKPMAEHLAEHGITELGDLDPSGTRPGTYEDHVKKVEERFWKERFPVYARWKRSWFDSYAQKGWMKTLTGFVCQGFMKRNEAINYPVQGSAFHCLLKSLILLVRRYLKKKGMKSLIVGQIHDSIVADVPPDELEEFLALAKRVMTVIVPRDWPWINVPLDVEADVAPVGGSWADKQPHKIGG